MYDNYIIHIAERLLAEFSKIIYSRFCIENSMAAILVSLECTNLYFPVLLPPKIWALKFILCFKKVFTDIYVHLQHSDIKPVYCKNKSTYLLVFECLSIIHEVNGLDMPELLHCHCILHSSVVSHEAVRSTLLIRV